MPIATPQGTLDFKSVDKVTFVGASSNTVIDTTTGSLGVGVGVGGPTSNLHVVGHTRLEGDINMLHTANTAAIKLNSNVVTEFPRSKKLIKYPRVNLTSASYNAYESGYKVTRSNASNSSYQEWEAFDGMPGDGVGWYSGGSAGTEYNGTGGIYNGNTRLATETELGEWLGLELPESIKLQYLRLVSQSYSPVTNTIDDFILYAKKQSGDTWTSLGLFTGKAPAQTSPSGVIVNIDANDYYKFFAIVARKSAISSLGVSIRELEYYGVPEYDPEAHGTDVVVKSVPNVPNTDWLEVYYDAKDLADGAVSTAAGDITGLGGTTNNGTAYGNPQISDGAFDLDGTGDYIITAPIGFTGDQVHSVSLWFWSDKPQSDMTTEHGLYSFGYGNNLHAGLSCWSPVTLPNQTFRFWHAGSGGKNFPRTTFLEDMWNHIVVVYPGDGADNIRIWLNGVEITGVQVSSVNSAFNWSASDTILIGDWYDANGPYGQSSWDGKIANFRLFNRALSQDEIYQLYAYQKEYFGHGDLSMTLKAGRLGIGTSEPRAALDVRGIIRGPGLSIQTVSSTKTDTSFFSGTSVTDIGGLSITIHPKFANSKIYVGYHILYGGWGRNFFRLKRTRGSSTSYFRSDLGPLDHATTSRATTTDAFGNNDGSTRSASFFTLDNANGLEPITYTVEGWTYHASYYVCVNRAYNEGAAGNESYHGRGISSISAQEVCQ